MTPINFSLFLTSYISPVTLLCPKPYIIVSLPVVTSDFLLLNAAAKRRSCDVTLHAVGFYWGER